jgi:hypothetical protein
MTCSEVKRSACRVLVGKSEGKSPLEDPDLCGRINIKMDLTEIGWDMWTRLIWFGIGTSGELL